MITPGPNASGRRARITKEKEKLHLNSKLMSQFLIHQQPFNQLCQSCFIHFALIEAIE